MAMQPVYLKEHEGIGHNSVGQYSSVNSSAPWWSNNAFGSQSVYGGESCGQMKPFSLELSNYIDQLAPTKHLSRGVEQLFDKGHHTTNQFTIFPGKFAFILFISNFQFYIFIFWFCIDKNLV
jgi:nuclear transcription factor Y alpha